MGFFGGICLPCYELLAELLPGARPLLDQVRPPPHPPRLVRRQPRIMEEARRGEEIGEARWVNLIQDQEDLHSLDCNDVNRPTIKANPPTINLTVKVEGKNPADLRFVCR